MKLNQFIVAILALSSGAVLGQNRLSNGDFENTSAPFPAGWTITGTPTSVASIVASGSSACRLATSQAVYQDFASTTPTDGLSNWQADFAFRISALTQTHRIRVRGNATTDMISMNITGGSGTGAINTYNGSAFVAAVSGLNIAINTTYYVRVTGFSFGTASRAYTVGFSSDGTNYTTSGSLANFHSGVAATTVFETIDFECGATASTAFTVDNVVVTDLSTPNQPPTIATHPGSTSVVSGNAALLTVTATGAAPLSYQWYQGLSGTTNTPVGLNSASFTTPALTNDTSYWVRVTNVNGSADSSTATISVTAPPNPPLVVNISGVYPHLAATDEELECGIGAVVPWAGRLWSITYSPHMPNGSTTKLYEIDTNLNLVIRPESVGGTPANRFIHKPSSQLNIGPYFIDTNRNVRVLRPTGSSTGVIPGRLTGTAAHLTDTNRLYIFTMEDGLYDVNVSNLTYITRYPDVQGTGDSFLAGYHGKGAYTGQNRLVVGNNGEPNQTMPSGVLATWDGTTNGAGQMVAWNQIERIQTCEVTGPGGIAGNPNPATDPIWTTGFDAKSVILHSMEANTFYTWRLPKASYTHDGSHGWHTEWPRIRQLDPEDPGSPYLMHMHGLFFDFPKTFSSTNFSGLTPLCDYYKMPVDYCMFGGRLVIAKNDTSKFDNSLVPRAQSGYWFGQLSDLQQWGQPTGHGAVWMNEAVTANQTSDPFLIQGFSQRTLHLKNAGVSAISVDIQTSPGTTNWTLVRSVSVPAGGYVYEMISDLAAPWVRLKVSAAASSFSAFFHLSNPYPHAPVASLGTDRFAALADIRDTNGCSDGIIRVMSGTDLKLEFASDSGYHQIGADLVLNTITNPTAEASFRSTAALTQDFGSDAASAWIIESSVKYRLPKLDPLYDSPFLSGWARGLREVVTERRLLNCHGTFYEVPRDISGGMRKMRALATHGKRITDFAAWRGLFVLTGVLDDAPASDSLIKTSDGSAALWLGEVDDLWRMGEPRGLGGPWLNTVVAANTPSDPYLMYGYDRKELKLSHTNATPVTFTVQVDFLADNTWSTYNTFTVNPGETYTHVFPTGFHAHWVRVSSSAATIATAQFNYGPTVQRDVLLDWARTNSLTTASGRYSVAMANGDADSLPNMAEFILGTNPAVANNWPLVVDSTGLFVTLRNLTPADGFGVTFESSTNLQIWVPRPDLVAPSASQSGVPVGFTRYQFVFTPAAETQRFVRLRLDLL